MAARKRLKMGRPAGPPEDVRRNRVATTFTDGELRELERMADERRIPVGTLLYELVKPKIRRR